MTMKVAITGGDGFLGWHTACRLRALHGLEPLRITRSDFLDVRQLTTRLSGVDVVIHLAGVNRAQDPEVVEAGNIELAEKLLAALSPHSGDLSVVFANSIHAGSDTPYGRGKAQAAEVLRAGVKCLGGKFADVRLPNLFGEHGRPHYNSFVATFVHEILSGGLPRVTDDREISLLHVQNAADALIGAIGRQESLQPSGESRRVTAVLEELQSFHALYYKTGEIPDIRTPFARDLFNTYRAAAFPTMWPIYPQVHEDARGRLFETVRSHGGTGMAFMSVTRPGHERGHHYHLHKVERFSVIQGDAEISLRRLMHDEIVKFRVSGTQASFIDMPTLWVHSIKNIGEGELVTMFWADQLLSHESPDHFPQRVYR